MKHKLTIALVGNVHVISDDGRIARLFQLPGGVAWEMAVEAPSQLAERVRQMEGLLEEAEKRAAQGLIPIPGAGSGYVSDSGGGSSMLTSFTASGGTGKLTIDPPGTAPIESLPIRRRYTWRLKKAGITTIGQLAGMTEKQLSEMPGIGEAVVKQAKRGMAKLGIRLAKKVSADQKKGKRR